MTWKSGDYFPVEAIRDKKMEDGSVKYLVKWTNWSEESNTWEPIANLENVMYLVKEFENGSSSNIKQGISFEAASEKSEKEMSSNFESNSEYDSDSSFEDGSLSQDIPLRILSMKEFDKEVFAECEWMMRKKDGIIPNKTFVNREDLKSKYPLMLCDYYESKLKFPK